MKNPRGSRTRRPAGSAVQGRDSGKFAPDRPGFGEIATYLARSGAISNLTDQRPIVQNFQKILTIVRDSRIRRPAGSAAQWRDSRGLPTRSAEIRRNLQLRGATWCNVAPHGSAVDCVEYSGYPDNLRDSRTRRTAGSVAKWRTSGKSPSGRPGFGEIAPYLGRPGAVSHLMDQWPNAQNFQKIMKNSHGSRIRRPAGSAAQGRDSGKYPPGRPRFGETATYLRRHGAISHLMDQWPLV